MRFAIFPVLLMLCAGCEKKLTPEEIEQKELEIVRSRTSPTPKPQLTKDHLKDYKSPLEPKK